MAMTKYILLIDGDPDQHDYFEWALARFNDNFRLLSAGSAAEGIKIFRKVKPEASFINFELDDMPGLACLIRIKSIKGSEKIPVYLYSRHITEQIAIRAKAFGATDCLDMHKDVTGLDRCLYKALTEKKIDSHKL